MHLSFFWRFVYSGHDLLHSRPLTDLPVYTEVKHLHPPPHPSILSQKKAAKNEWAIHRESEQGRKFATIWGHTAVSTVTTRGENKPGESVIGANENVLWLLKRVLVKPHIGKIEVKKNCPTTIILNYIFKIWKLQLLLTYNQQCWWMISIVHLY